MAMKEDNAGADELITGCLMMMLLFVDIFTLPIQVVWRGYVLSILWGWFMAPLGLPTIQLAHAIGVAVIVAMLSNKPVVFPDTKTDKATSVFKIIGWGLFWSIAGPSISLGAGYMAHCFMQ